MGILKRGTTWWIDITAPGGQRVRQSAETTDRKAAKELHDRLKHDLWRQAKLQLPAKRRRFQSQPRRNGVEKLGGALSSTSNGQAPRHFRTVGTNGARQ